MRDVFEIIATKRSGHHAFIEWFCTGRPSPIVFYNHMRPCLTPKSRAIEYFEPGSSESSKFHGKKKFNITLDDGKADIIFNFEGGYPENLDRWNSHFVSSNSAVNFKKLLFLRDPLNTVASAARRVDPRRFISELKFYDHVFSLSEILSRVANDSHSFCDEVILYSPWLTRPDYRQSLGIRFSTTPRMTPRNVSSYGDGSSFNGMQFDPVSNQQELFRRWETMKDDPYFLSVFLDRDIRTAFLDYFEKFSEFEFLGPQDVDRIADRAREDRKADKLCRLRLQPLRRALPQLKAMNRDAWSIARKYRQSLIRLRVRGFS